jgi:hypothetical protein
MKLVHSWFECRCVAVFDTPEGLRKMEGRFARRILDGEHGAKLKREVKESSLSKETKANLYLNIRNCR